MITAKVLRFTTQVREQQRNQGSRAAFEQAATLMLAAVTYRIRLYSEWRFDRVHSIDTRGIVPLEAEVANTAVHSDGTRYQSSRPRDFRRLVRTLPLALPQDSYTFVDLGCGKGRVLILAAEYGFQRVLGIELDSRLVEVARANVRSVQARQQNRMDKVEVLTGDAATFTLPLGPTIIYMYNPFGEQTVREVASNVQRSLELNPRPLLVVYYNPVHQHLFKEVPTLHQVPSGAPFWSFFRTSQTTIGSVLEQ
jgi:predicted RNA methylase